MRIACIGLLLSLVASARGEVISRLVDATGADVAEAGLPAEVQVEVARVRKKSTWPAGSSVVVVRAAVPAGAAGDGAIELCRGSSTSSWSVISAREPVRVASFGVTPGAGDRVCARLFGYQSPGKDIPAIAGAIVWLGDLAFEPVPAAALVSIKGRITLSGGQPAPEGTVIEARPRNTNHGPEFPVKGGEYHLALVPDQYFLRPRLAGWRAPRQGQTVRLAAGSPAADADFVLEQVVQVTLRQVWPTAQAGVTLDFDIRGLAQLPLDDRQVLQLIYKDGQVELRYTARKPLINVFPGPFVDGATSLTAIRGAPTTAPWNGSLKTGDLITVALNANSLATVVEVVAIGKAAPPEPVAPGPVASIAGTLPQAGGDPPDPRLERVIADAVAALLGDDTSRAWSLLTPEVKSARGPEAARLARGLYAAAKKLDAAKSLARFVLLSNAYQAAAIGLDATSQEATRLAIDYADAGVKQHVVREPAKILGGIYDRLRATLPEDDPQLLTVRFRLARALARDHQQRAAVPHLEAVLAQFEKRKGPESAEVATCLHELGLARSSRPAESIRALTRALAIRDKAGPTSAPALETAMALAGRWTELLRFESRKKPDGGKADATAAEPVLRRVLAARRAESPQSADRVHAALTDLLNALEVQERTADAEAVARELVAMPDLKPEAAVWAKLRLGELCGRAGKRAEARPLIQSYLDWASKGQVSREEEYNVPENPWKIAPLRALARLDLADGKLVEAAAGVKHAIEISKKFESADSRVSLLDLQLEIHAAARDNTAGEAVARELEKIVVERGHALKRSEIRSALTQLVRFWTGAGKPADAARATAQLEKLDPGR